MIIHLSILLLKDLIHPFSDRVSFDWSAEMIPTNTGLVIEAEVSHVGKQNIYNMLALGAWSSGELVASTLDVVASTCSWWPWMQWESRAGRLVREGA